jgi:hypothetical protein
MISVSNRWLNGLKTGAPAFAVVLGAVLDADRVVPFSALGLAAATTQRYVAYEANSTSTILVGDSIKLTKCGKYDFQVFAVAPVLGNGGWTLLGTVLVSASWILALITQPAGHVANGGWALSARQST